MSAPLLYGTSDSNHFALSAAGLWISYSSFTLKYMYLYKSPIPIWVEAANGGSGQVMTGDQVQIYTKLTVTNGLAPYLNATNSRTNWTYNGSSIWQLYLDTNNTPNQPISFGDTIYVFISFISQTYPYPGYLQRESDDSPYIDTLPTNTPLGFSIETYTAGSLDAGRPHDEPVE